MKERDDGVVDRKKDDSFEGIKEEKEEKVDCNASESSVVKENDIKREEEKPEISKSPIEIQENNGSENNGSEELKVKSKSKEKKVEREESKLSDFKEDYEEIDEEKGEENSENEIKDDFEDMNKNVRVTHKRKSVLENQIFHDNVDACEISDDELD